MKPPRKKDPKPIVDLGLGVFNPIEIDPHTHGYILREFQRTGESVHSRRMDTLGWLIDYCHQFHIPYLVTTENGMGFIKNLNQK